MWNYINGEIKVKPMGRSPEEQEYILKTVLNHLPIVTGSETAMRIDIVDLGSTCSSSTDELGNCYGRPDLKGNWHKYWWHEHYNKYKLVLTGNLRHTEFDEIYKSFWKWLIRLGKRIEIDYVLVDITDRYNQQLIYYPDGLRDLFETPTWASDEKDIEDAEPNWCEYLMWDGDCYSRLPIEYVYKYYNSDVIDEEMTRRLKFRKDSINRRENR